ncbi:S-adenosyl-L-methionine-dependent methyltransferase [Amylocarpus encephaloides]|uniref:Leucine carboxyl methyltransferase 1 n=1 Tax=Amylocarpus encephaloides TaxID=45428 RepID=A0A9P7YLA1_9HELO|nr:S-adenosyl-L-methionine-dependent methyltransferase [Amylocarpus encephaloides]
MSAPQIPNLLLSPAGGRSRGGRGPGRGRGRGRISGRANAAAIQSKDLDIQSTDTDAAVSRLSAVSLGYLDDPFASLFVNGPSTRRQPIINRGTYARTTALDILINAFLSHEPLSTDDITPTRQIISLGAGTDTRYFRLRAKNMHHNLIYHEFDFPSVCATKRQITSGSRSLSMQDDSMELFAWQENKTTEEDQEPAWGFARREDSSDIRYCCHPLDLRSLPYTPPMSLLDYFTGVRSDIPTLIISECCLCYLEVENAQEVVEWFADRIESLGIILYEPIGVDDPFGQMMVSNLAARNITMPTVKVYKTLDDQKRRLSDLIIHTTDDGGAQEAETVGNIWEKWISPQEKERVDNLEGLDEVEEWQMLARHYAVVWGWRGKSGWENWEALKENQ